MQLLFVWNNNETPLNHEKTLINIRTLRVDRPWQGYSAGGRKGVIRALDKNFENRKNHENHKNHEKRKNHKKRKNHENIKNHKNHEKLKNH